VSGPKLREIGAGRLPGTADTQYAANSEINREDFEDLWNFAQIFENSVQEQRKTAKYQRSFGYAEPPF